MSDWRDLALCREVDAEAFFPSVGSPNTAAKMICAECEVNPQCLAFAMANKEPYGVWGGLSTRERQALALRGQFRLTPIGGN